MRFSTPKIARVVAAEAVLGLPAGQIGVDQDIGLGKEARAAADHQHQTGRDALHALPHCRNGGRVEELRKRQTTQPAEDRVVAAQKRLDKPIDLFRRQHGFGRPHGECRMEPGLEHGKDLQLIDAGVALDDEDRLWLTL